MSLDVFQQIFRLSLTSNLVNFSKGPQDVLQSALQAVLPSTFPDPRWKLVWGPVVWKHLNPEDPTTGPDNSWYVAFHPSLQFEDGSVHPTYVIAVAGTPPDAPHVWETQNFAVNTVADFNHWVSGGIQNRPQIVRAQDIVPGTPYIATGTVNTVQFLLNTSAPGGAVAAGTTLLEFITSIDGSGSARFITTGHSLGGALSPSLALSLVSAGAIPADKTLTYPTAGPSPGNVAFSNLFAEVFPARGESGRDSYKVWNLNLVNTLDIVPQAWAIGAVSPNQSIRNIPLIYGSPALPLTVGLALLLFIQASRSGVLYLPLPSQFFTGTPPTAPPQDIEEFLQIALKQHQDGYLELLGVPLSRSVVLSGNGITEKPVVEQRFNYPIIAGFEWAREHPKEAADAIKEAEDSQEGKGALEL